MNLLQEILQTHVQIAQDWTKSQQLYSSTLSCYLPPVCPLLFCCLLTCLLTCFLHSQLLWESESLLWETTICMLRTISYVNLWICYRIWNLLWDSTQSYKFYILSFISYHNLWICYISWKFTLSFYTNLQTNRIL